jgi:hypothetical protein
MCSVIDGSKAVIMTQSNFCDDKARCLITVIRRERDFDERAVVGRILREHYWADNDKY